jgi:tRNA(fMet)-specific endonuclease VapC
MRRYLLDSNALNAFATRHSPLALRAESVRALGGQLGTCEPVIAEMYAGLELSVSRDANIVLVERSLRRLRVWPFDRRAAREYGRIAADLKRRGRKMQVIDMMVAAIARTLSHCSVVTTDSDFAAIPGLSVVDWTTDPSP